MLVNMNEVLQPARENGTAVGLFNTCSLELARGVLEAAEELGSPVIIGTAEVLLPSASLRTLADLLIPAAERANVPVVVHLDHGLREETCLEALDLGFTSIMFDCSTDPYEKNVDRVAAMAERAHGQGATIEGELGHVGGTEGSAAQETAMFYTDPAQAEDFAKRTGVDALAIAVGTAHGAYRLPPKLDFERIRAIRRRVTPYLVLHGGSGLTDEDFRRAIAAGISKVNIFTDLNLAGAKAAHDIYDAGGLGITDAQPAVAEAVREAAKKKIRLFRNMA